MKEPSTPQVYYDGSLKELATRHVGLVKAVLFTLIITIPVSAALIQFYNVAYFVYQKAEYGYAYVYVKTEYSDLIRVTVATLAAGFMIHGVCNLLYRFYRLSALLYPHVAVYFTLLLFVPFLNLLVILLLWWAGLRQMRGRGLRVGFFGIDPARVE